MPVQSYLTGEDLKLRNTWLKRIFFPIAFGQATVSDGYISEDLLNKKDLIIKIFETIKDGTFTDLDEEFTALAKLDFYKPGADAAGGEIEKYNLSPVQMANFLVDVCRVKAIYWDDINNDDTVQEINYFKTETIFGRALSAANLFGYIKNGVLFPSPTIMASRTIPAPTPVTSAPKSSPAPPAPSAPQWPTPTPMTVAPRMVPKTSATSGSKLFKATATGLVSPEKFNVGGSEVYWIKGKFLDATAKTSPRIHVSPLQATVPLKVKYTSGQGFDDCILYFDDKNVADNFLMTCIQKCQDTRIDTGAFELRKITADPNGYFRVSTEFGQALIQASKLHESAEITEEKKEDLPVEKELTVDEYQSKIQEAWNMLCEFID